MIAAIDWSMWGPPASIVVLGVVAGWALLGRARAADASITNEGDREDLEHTKQAVLQALRALDQEREKLTPEDYKRERAILLQRGAAALRTLDEATDEAPRPAATSGAQDNDAFEALYSALEALRSEAEPAVWSRALSRYRPATVANANAGIAPEWKGALVALGSVALVALLVNLAGGESNQRRGMGPMTGGSSVAPPAQQQAADTAWADQMKVSWRERLDANPNDLEALNGMAWVGLTTNDLATAREYNARALKADPNNTEARIYDGVLTAFVGMPEQGVQKIDAVLAEHPDHPKAVTYKGLLSLELGRGDDAVTYLRKAIELQGDNSALRSALNRALALTGEAPSAPPGAEVVLSGTITIDPATVAKLGDKTLFVSVRSPSGGPPLAALKLSPAASVPFQVTSADAISMGGPPRPFPAQINLSARIDLDGNPMTKDGPSASLQGVAKGSTDLALTLQ